MRRKIKYKEYGNIYANFCVKCENEGTAFCSLDYEDGVCLNFILSDESNDSSIFFKTK